MKETRNVEVCRIFYRPSLRCCHACLASSRPMDDSDSTLHIDKRDYVVFQPHFGDVDFNGRKARWLPCDMGPLNSGLGIIGTDSHMGSWLLLCQTPRLGGSGFLHLPQPCDPLPPAKSWHALLHSCNSPCRRHFGPLPPLEKIPPPEGIAR